MKNEKKISLKANRVKQASKQKKIWSVRVEILSTWKKSVRVYNICV